MLMAILGPVRDGADNTGKMRLYVYNAGRAVDALNIAATADQGRIGSGAAATSPAGKLHLQDGTNALLFVTKTGVVNMAQVIIANGTGDVVGGIIGLFVASAGGGDGGQCGFGKCGGDAVYVSTVREFGGGGVPGGQPKRVVFGAGQ